MTSGLHIDLRCLASPQRTLVENLQLAIAPGTIHTLMGPSGCGKSSLLEAVCGTLDDAMRFDGTVMLNGHAVDGLPVQQRRIGILFQDDLLFPHMNVLENLLFALPRGPAGPRSQQALQALHEVEMADFARADIATLSGGQRSRVALARALLAQPRALLLDEPFSRLDANLRGRMRRLVFDLVHQRQVPALLVTHDDADLADRAMLTRWPDPSAPHHN